MKYKIEKDIPNLGIKQGPKPKYPFGQMEVGDSFAFPREDIRRIRTSAHSYGREHDMKFSVRSDEQGGRAWRVA